MPNITRQFTREQLTAMGVPDEYDATGPAAEHLHEQQTSSRRWVSVHRLIFRAPDDGKAWAVFYERGLTEQQDGTDPWNGDDVITATAMEQREVTVTKWLPVEAPETAPDAR